MFRTARHTALITTASLLALGAAHAQDTEEATQPETDAAVEAEINQKAQVQKAEAKALSSPEITEMAETRFAEADTDGNEALDEDEYATFSRAFAGDLQNDYDVALVTDDGKTGSGTKIDITSSANIEAMRKRETSSVYDTAESEDIVGEASRARFAEINVDGVVPSSAIVADSSMAFDNADADGDELIRGEELDRFAERVTGLKVEAAAEAEVETETEEEDSNAQG